MKYHGTRLQVSSLLSKVLLWSQISYGHRAASISQKSYDFTAPKRRPAGGRKNRTIFYQFSDIVRCPVKLGNYLKFHGASTALGRFIDGKMAAPGRRLHISDGHRQSGHRTMSDNRQEL